MRHVLSGLARAVLIDSGWWIMGCPGFIPLQVVERALWNEFRRLVTVAEA